MKVGIVTFFCVPNYGAMLQAYSLWKYLESKGHAVVFVSHPRLAPDRPSLFRCFVSRHLNGIRIKLRDYVRFAMTSFAADYPQTCRCETIDEVKAATADCDAFIVGSDQMWNPLWCSGTCLPLVMLDFASKGKPRIAYAVSFGTKKWNDAQNVNMAKQLLQKFSAISIREESGVELLQSLAPGVSGKCLIDPVLLQTSEFYWGIVGDTAYRLKGEKDPYIFRYILDEWSDDSAADAIMDSVGEVLGVQNVKTDRMPVRGLLGPVCRLLGVESKVDVREWLERIAYAEFVVTNSFHGTVFSVLFHRPFISLLLKGPMSCMNERIISLLKKLGLSNRAVEFGDVNAVKAIIKTSIDWDSVDTAIAKEKEKANQFLDGLPLAEGK